MILERYLNQPWKRRAVLVSGAFVLLGVVFFAGRFSGREDEQRPAVSNGDTTSLVAEVSAIMSLPGDEQPTILTIRDTAPLQGQPFFEGAKVGDKFLVFAKAKKAILYDPVAHRIIQAGPYSVSQE